MGPGAHGLTGRKGSQRTLRHRKVSGQLRQTLFEQRLPEPVLEWRRRALGVESLNQDSQLPDRKRQHIPAARSRQSAVSYAPARVSHRGASYSPDCGARASRELPAGQSRAGRGFCVSNQLPEVLMPPLHGPHWGHPDLQAHRPSRAVS